MRNKRAAEKAEQGLPKPKGQRKKGPGRKKGVKRYGAKKR
jgi:hypothetical protein